MVKIRILWFYRGFLEFFGLFGSFGLLGVLFAALHASGYFVSVFGSISAVEHG